MTGDTEPETKEPNRDKMIILRVTENEKQRISDKSREAGYSKVSAYLRDVGQGAEINQRLPADVRRQLVGIGTNLNQIARLANSGQAFSNHEAQLQKALSVILGYLI